MYYTEQRQLIGADINTQYDLSANYNLGDKTQLYLQGSYLQRYSDKALAAVSPISGSLSIASIRLGVRRQLW